MTPTRIILTLVAIALLILAPLGQGTYFVYVLCSWLLFSISAMGLNLTLGYAGQVSLAQAAFMGALSEEPWLKREGWASSVAE